MRRGLSLAPAALRRNPPEGEAFEGAGAKAFPLRGRWLPEGQTDEVDDAETPDEGTPDTAPENIPADPAVGDVLAFDPADAHRREITALFDMVWRGLTAIAQSYGTYVKVIDLTQRPAGERAERSDTWTST